MSQSKIMTADITGPEDFFAPSRFAELGRGFARLLIALMLCLMAYGVAAPAPVTPATIPRVGENDVDLYRAVATRVATGESYYAAAAAEQRARHFPLRPFVTMRPPLLAETTALAGGPAVMGWVLRILALTTMIAFALRLREEVKSPFSFLAAIAITAAGLSPIAQPDLALWHEAWAATLITLSLALHRPGKWGASLIAGIFAALIRELALPWLFVMAFVAFYERRWREAAAWCGAAAMVIAALTVHAAHVAAVVRATDAVSPGWTAVGGWPFVLAMIGKTSLFLIVPRPFVALLVPLALLGWAGRGPIALRATLWLVGMIATFMFFGRPSNFYWGLLLAPLLPVGLAFAPRAVRDIAKAAR